MKFVRLVPIVPTLVFALAATACSEDDSPSAAPAAPESQTNANQPSVSSAGSTGSGAAGAGSTTPPAASAGTGAETPPANVELEPSNDDNAGSGPDSADASAPASPPAPRADAGAPPLDTTLSFFVTSRGVTTGANFGGLEGADELCRTLAAAVSPQLGAKNWKAYLSTTTVNARDRIGAGPWFNAKGVLVANDVAQLIDQGPGGALDQTWAPGDASIALDELGNTVPAGGGGAGGVQHDILTGTLLNGTVAAGLTCGDWTAVTGNVEVGHANRAGGGQAPTSWSSAHGNPSGCAPLTAPAPNVGSGGGRGSVYCFAAD